jgi:mediator of RNA polymerase II transcription subunit 25
MPKPIMQQLPPAIAAQLQRLTPDQRTLFIAQMMRGRPQLQQPQPPQQQFQPQQPQQPPNYNLGQPTFGDSGRFHPTNFQGNFTANGMNLLGNTPPGVNPIMNGAMVSMAGSQQGGMGGLHRRTPSGNAMPQAGGMSGVSYEILQSFMQRNGDGSGGGGMGPN